MQQLSWFVACYFPALFGVVACVLTIVILFLPARKNKTQAGPSRLRSFLRYTTPVAVGSLVMLLVAAGVLRLLEPEGLRRHSLPEVPKGLEGVPYTNPHWINAHMPAGQLAPDFTLPDLRTGTKVTFSQYRGSRPAILVFGSPGCNLFCDSASSVRQLYNRYKDKAAFVFIHVSNAPHNLPEWVARNYQKVDQEVHPRDQRQAKARVGAEYFDFPFPCLLDTEDKQVETLYDAWPRRLIVVQPDGRIARDIGRGLFSTWNFREVQASLAQQLPKTSQKEPAHAASTPRTESVGNEKVVASHLLLAGSVPPAPAYANRRRAQRARHSSPAPLG